MIRAGRLDQVQWTLFLLTRLLLISDDCRSYPQNTLHYLWLKQSRVAYRAKFRFNVYSGEGLQYGSALAPLIAYWRRKTFDFLATSSRLPASKVSFSSFMDVLLRVGKARWMTAALFGPVGSNTNNPIMLPGEMQKAACQEHSAV